MKFHIPTPYRQIIGMALGRMGMRLDDLRRLTVGEFEESVRQWMEKEEAKYHDEWERMRLLATISMMPHTKKHVTPHGLLPLPWDTKGPVKSKRKKTPAMYKESQRRRFEYLMTR